MLRLLVVVAALATVLADSQPKKAVVFLKQGDVEGKVTFTQQSDGVLVEGSVKGLSQGKHGFHIHEKGDISGGCASAGAHFNPEKKNHGAPTDSVRHVGDLGNIEADASKTAQIKFTDKVISLTGPNSIIGRAVVVHADEDDLGKGGKSDSLTTGHAGDRLACGIIGIL